MSVLPASATGSARIEFRDVFGRLWLLPRNIGVGLLLAYRATISRTYGDVCKYYPSCSAYAVGAVQQHGLVKGSGMTALRIARCHPWAQGGIDDVPAHQHRHYDLTRLGFVARSEPVAPAGKD